MLVKGIPTGELQENCYIVMDENTKDTVICDPGDDFQHIVQNIEKLNGKVLAILLTHAHFDHIGAVVELHQKYNVPVYMHEKEEEYMKKDNYVYRPLPKIYTFIQDNEILNIGSITIKVIYTPGHTKGGVCFLIGDKLITGDTLFQGSIGRSDFIGGNFEELITSIKTRLLDLPGNTEVFPGHGPKSTINFEKLRNPYLSDMDIF